MKALVWIIVGTLFLSVILPLMAALPTTVYATYQAAYVVFSVIFNL